MRRADPGAQRRPLPMLTPGLMLAMVVAANLEAQVLHSGGDVLAAPRVLALPSVPGPALVVVNGRPASQSSGDILLALDDQPLGRLSGFALTPGHFEASLPLPEGAAGQKLSLSPEGAGLVLGRVELTPAAILEVETLDETTRAAIPAIVQVVALDGREPPHYVSRAGETAAGSARLLPAGRGSLVLPAEVSATLLAWTHPFRRPARRHLRPESRSRAGVRFLLGADHRPPGAFLLEVLLARNLEPPAAEELDLVLGIGRRLEGEEVWSAAEAVRDRQAFALRLLDEGQRAPLLTSRTGRGGLPASPRDPRTLLLPNGARLHSNGPIMGISGLSRHRLPGGLSRVRGLAQVSFDREVIPGRFWLRTVKGPLLQLPLEAPGPIPLELDLPPGTRVLAGFEGQRFQGDPALAPPPLAWRSFIVP